MKQILLIITLILCGMTMEAQTDNVSRRRNQKQNAEQTTTNVKNRNSRALGAKKKKSNNSLPSPTLVKSSYTPEVKTYYANGVAFQMVEVRGGTFTMGAISEQGSYVESDEKPAHKVTLSDYYIGKTEVTQALWEAVMGNNPSGYKGENLPVENISWDDCKEFISKLNALTGKTFRMPTEAEWEYAVRGGSKSRGYKYSGSNRLGDVAWYDDNSGGKTHEVGTKSPNELGLYDMSGNVWEWCNDWYGDYSSASQTNPKGPDSGTSRVDRGGSWCSNAWGCHCSNRSVDGPGIRFSNLGLRLCLSDNEEPESSFDIPIVETYSVNGVTFDVIKVEGGTFTMGATSEQSSDAASYEEPAHKVTLSDYYIGKTEVTQALWDAVMGKTLSQIASENGGYTYGVGDNYPMYVISWNDCKEFISKLNTLTGKNFRMPTEAEWEYAARGGRKSRGYKYSGSNNIDDVAWYWDNSGGKTHEVGTKSPNELGLYDMSGNVCEWCSDWYGDYSSAAQADPKGPNSGTFRVHRGGSWSDDAGYCRCSNRGNDVPGNRNYYLGLRLCLSDNADPETSSDITIVETYIANGELFDMIKVEGGTFTMGATSEQGADAYSDEKPAHKVTLSDYYIGKTEVTQALWEAVMGKTVSQIASEGGRDTYGAGDNYPMYYISWNDCKEFISKLNALTGKTFRMPTEAEWEYAARGGSKSRGYKYSGSNTLDDVAWYGDNLGYKTHPVGTKSPNELGLYDMSGNVWEWCSDWYGDYSSAYQTNPKGPDSGTYRVSRGGSWNSRAVNCRCSNRINYGPDYRNNNLGLRLCLSE